MSLSEDRMRLLGFPAPWRRVLPPAEPPLEDLEAQSKHRERSGLNAQIELQREEARRHGASVTDTWPDPHGPDPIVFGSEPRVGP